MAKVLVVGGGGREHAIVHALSKSKKVEKIFAAPGNAGIANLAECLNIKDTEIKTITEDMVITNAKATPEQLSDMNFGWKIVKHVKSNAIVVVKNGTTCGVGAGQMNRVGAAKIAIEEAHSRGVTEGLVLASDAFFPFSDTLEYGINNGVVAVVQPGGSKKDQDSIDLANAKNVPMAFTGMRHFKH